MHKICDKTVIEDPTTPKMQQNRHGKASLYEQKDGC